MGIYKDIKLEEDEFAFFVPEFIFTQILAVNKKVYPWYFRIIKEGNKFIFYEKISPENPFLFFQTMNENDLENMPDSELELAAMNEENTLVEESFYNYLGGELKGNKTNYQYLKITLDEQHSIYTKISLDGKEWNDKKEL